METVAVSAILFGVRSDSSTPCLEEVYTNEETILVPKLPKYMRPKRKFIPPLTKDERNNVEEWIKNVISYPSDDKKKGSDEPPTKKRRC